MSDGVTVNITANAQAYEQALQRLGQLQSQFEQKLRGVGETSKKVGREERELNRARLRVLQQVMTPQEKYNQKVGELDRLLKANKLSQDQYNRAVGQAKTQMDGAAQSGEKAFGPKMHRMTTQLLGALGLTGGVAGAIQIVRMEYEHLIEAQRQAASATLTQAQTQEVALVNLGATTEAQRDKFVSASKAMAASLGVSETEVYRRASDALSARGDKPVYGPGGAMDAVRASFSFSRGDPQAGIASAGAALDLSSVTKATADESLGFLQAIGQKARITDPRKLAVNLPPAMTAATSAGADPRTAGALFAALTQGMTDPTGESSRTASIAFSQQLRGFQDTDEWVNMSMSKRIARLQSDPALRDQFLAKASFEKRAQAPIEQLLSGGSVAGMYSSFLADLPTMKEAGQQFTTGAAVRRGADSQRVADLDRAMGSVIERAETDDPAFAGMGRVRDQFASVLQQAGVGYVGSKMHGLAAWSKGDNLGAYAEQARHAADSVMEPSMWGGPGVEERRE
ncbi:MAG: hypothetical protein GX616_07020, partial [Planctomycetes bacterium]|nr:hypothetical protein [Planctomycetota bacterium]